MGRLIKLFYDWMAARIANLEGYRKWSIMFLTLAAAIVFRHLGYVNGAEWVDLIKVTVVAFFGTNLSEHAINAYKAIKSPKEPGE